MNRRRQAMLVAAVLAAGCGGAKPRPAAPAETPRAVFFSVVDGTLAPLACYDGASAKRAGAEACLEMVPKEAKVHLGDGSETATAGRKAVPCAVGGPLAAGLAAPALQVANYDQFAVWSTGPAPAIESFPRPGQGKTVALPEAEAARVAAAVPAEAPGPPLVTQALDIDLDGDGKPERVYSVHVLKVGEEDDLEFAFSGLLAGPIESGSLAVVLRGDAELFTVLAAIGLDGGSARSLFIDRALYEGTTRAVVRLAGGQLATVGQWSCGR